MTRVQAIAMFESGWWEDMGLADAALFQLGEKKLCMPFDQFQKGTEQLLGRPVWTHEFAKPAQLLAELKGDRPTPTFGEILAKLSEDARVIVVQA